MKCDVPRASSGWRLMLTASIVSACLALAAGPALALNVYFVGSAAQPEFVATGIQDDDGTSYNTQSNILSFTSAAGTTRCAGCSVNAVLYNAPRTQILCYAGGYGAIACGLGGVYQYGHGMCYQNTGGYVWTKCYKVRS